MTIGVLLVDDDELVRSALQELIAREEGLSVVGEAGSAAEALSQVSVTHPRVVLTEAILPDASGAELCRALRTRHPELAIVLLTSLSADGAFIHASMGGAAGYLLKPIRKGEVIDAIRRVGKGERLLDTGLMSRILGQWLEEPVEGERPRIGDEEKEILLLVADGLTDPEIAAQLGMDEEAVTRQVSEVFTKLGIRSGTGASAPRE